MVIENKEDKIIYINNSEKNLRNLNTEPCISKKYWEIF